MTDPGAAQRAASSTQVAATSVDDPGIAELLALAVGGDNERLDQVVRRYHDEPSWELLAATVSQHPVGVLGYVVTEAEATVIHIATAPSLRGTGIGSMLLQALRRRVPAGLPTVAETDSDAVGFYRSNGFHVASLGQKYPGVERFRVTSRDS